MERRRYFPVPLCAKYWRALPRITALLLSLCTQVPVSTEARCSSTVPPAPEAPSLSRVWRDVRDFKAFGSRVTQRCAVLGRLQNNTRWKPDSCQDCQCRSSIVTCEPTACTAPRCDFQQGEVLRIAPNKCCPECASRAEGSCQHDGQTHSHGSQWSGAGCVLCSCAHGTVRCSPTPCPDVACATGELPYTAPGSCCPRCLRRGQPCSFDGQLFRDSEDWRLGRCAKCVCMAGAARCFTASCQPLLCSQDEVTVVSPGKCCPECVPKPCSVAGTVYQHGEQWKRDACTTCACHRGEVRCVRETCAAVTCDKGQSKARRPGRCCQECVSAAESCLYNGTASYHGQMWNSTRCDFCMCHQGQVTCQPAECAKVECAEGEELVHLDGKCCPECISSNSHCVYKEHTKANGEKWDEGPCRECECREAEVTCFQRACPPCPRGHLPAPAGTDRDCCPRCQPGECHPDCLTCSQSWGRCDACRDARKRLQDGRCVETCEPGFYQDGDVCLACSESCSACADGFECRSCRAPLLLQGGRCVASCAERHFQDRLLCTACHESCSSCRGAAEDDCSSCRDTALVLHAGRCVASCPPGFYPRDGVCTACDQSCETCSAEQPRCLSCAPGRILHRGRCVPECPRGHFPSGSWRCRACHDSCSTCEGPLATHCTSCPRPLALRQGQCLQDCGEGFYQDHDVCKGCHPSCRACLGPGASRCRRCRVPEHVLQPRQPTQGAEHGSCVSRCQAAFYPDSAGVCRQCHSSCAGCTGGSSQDCTACPAPRVLLAGRCVPACPAGLFARGQRCSACHPSCRTCRGPSHWECVTCHPHASLAGGTCRTSCPEEQYLNLVGYCVDCHPLCRRCVANLRDTGSVCLQCHNHRHLLLGDRCVPGCPPGAYADSGACRGCHPSCEACSGEGPFSCSACNASLLLSHTGACVSVCPQGYYSDGSRTCRPCDSQCRSCESAAGCTSCRDPARVLQFGECRYESCAQQYYLDLSSGTCRECDWSCNACKGPGRTDCLQCMEGYVLHDGACVEQCPAGYYQESDTCQRCDDERCLQCRQPDQCSLCQAPFFLLDARCVRECGKRHYADEAQRKCTACPPGCLECDSSSLCRLCDSTTFLSNNTCLPACGQGFYGNTWTRQCEEASKRLSSFHVSGPLTVGIGGVKPLDLSLLGVGDAAADTGRLVFHVASAPSNGRLVLLARGRELPLGHGDRFSCEDVRQSRVRFEHSRDQARKGQFSLKVSDEQFFSQPEVVTVQAFSTQAPYVFRNEALLVRRGETGAITDLLLGVRDSDNPQDVVLLVLEPPRHGQLVKPGHPGAVPRFQLGDLAGGLLRYAHDGSDSRDDAVVLQVTDGYHFQNILFHIKIAPKSDGAPVLASSPRVWVPQGGMLQISRTVLRAELPGARHPRITYSIRGDPPRHGDVVLLVPADGPADPRQLLPDGRAASPTRSFTQQDVDDGLVWYRHSGAAGDSDSFQFEVSGPQTSAESHVFSVAVLPQPPGAPRLSPGSSLHVAVLEDRVTVIEPHHLSFVDPEVPSEKILFNVTVPLLPGQGVVEHRDRPLSAVRCFTQADINHGKIAYRPPSAAPHLREITAFSFAGLPESVTFRFTVSDGEHSTPEMPFVIHLLSAEQQPPLFQTAAPLLEVTRGGRATMGTQLAVSDTDTAPEGLFFELVQPPRHGVVLKSSTDGQERMRAGDTFTYEDVTRTALQYVHDGSSAAEDSMEISVTDGVTTVSTVLRVAVSPWESSAPQLAPGCSLAITVPSNSSVTLSRLHLAYTDDTSPDSEIRIQLVSAPAHGSLVRTSGSGHEELAEVHHFTMEDINDRRISYSTALDPGTQPVTDTFHFTVSDAENNQLDGQVFTVTIVSAQAVPSLIAFADHIAVDEGGRVPLLARHRLALDYDAAAREELKVTVLTLPTYGCIENTKTGERFGPQSAVTAGASFSVQDVLDNSIYYFQSVHESIEPTSDVFSFYVSDGFSRSEVQSVNITVQRQNDEPPRVALEPVRVREGSAVVVTNTSLNLQDLDTHNSELVILVTKSPDHGRLRRRQTAAEPPERGHMLAPGSAFTYQDILDELIVYTQSGAAAQTDEFGFSITDGLYTQTGTLEFSVEHPKKQLPSLSVNRGLQLPAGSAAHLTEQHLEASAVDSDDTRIRFVMKRDPSVGQLQLAQTDELVRISAKGPVKSFTQADVNKGQVLYSHKKGDPGGNFTFLFDVIDADGDKLMDQSFYISVLEDRFPPSIVANEGLVLDENSAKTLTTLQLCATDRDSEPSRLQYQLTRQPQLGQLEHLASPGRRISSFSQADLDSHNIRYVHTSDAEKHMDAFTFTVSDGTNEVSQTFHITINPVDDSLPVVQSLGMTVQEGLRKTITEFELKARDADTEAESITFTVVQPPRHGLIERTSSGQRYHRAATFTMDDIYQNRVSYSHDGSNSLQDRFTFTVSDGTNPLFIVEDGGKEVVTAAPQHFQVDILPVDDGTPRVVTNLGLQWLEYIDGEAANVITKKELLVTDPDTDDKQLIYEITAAPRNGYVENKLKPGVAVTTFTQEDVNQGLIRYVVDEEKVRETVDSFQFLVRDSKPNVISGNVFHVQWSLLSFTHTSYSVQESAGSVSIPVRRVGNLNQYAIVLCRTEQGTATSSSARPPGLQDYVEYAGQVQFEEREDAKACTITINDDTVFEGTESFTVELSAPAYALLGNVTRATVTITDTEDEPTLQFTSKTHHVSESAGVLSAPVERKGDTSSTVSAICYTIPKSAKGSSLSTLESGSDFKSRGLAGDSRIVFGPGVTTTTCDVMLIDDSEYEEEEEFELVLADASDNARIGSRASATVFIAGPNDVSMVFLGNATFTVSEAAGTVEIPVLRQGPDLSAPISVWCATRTSDPPSASPGNDYVPSSKKIEFRPGKTEEFCTVTILDDAQYPVIEGLETFVVYLSSPHGAELAKPFQAIVAITDIFQDMPSMQFGRDTYTVKEPEGALHIPVLRSGDLSYESSVRCYTRSQTAEGMQDFAERRNTEESRVTFFRGEKVKNCTVSISDDSAFEPEEQFQVCLGSPLGNHWSGARTGKVDLATVTITNDEDAPTIEFEEAAYQVREPPGPEGVAVLNIKVLRRGDQNRTSRVRCSTRDGSAQAGLDYYPKSRMLKFSPGVTHLMFKVEIMSNEDREWHESFSVVLGPDDPVDAVLGDTSTATVTILDQEATGSLILPAPPVVVSLADYDRVAEVTKAGAKKSPSPGYPLVCVTPCDPRFPQFSVTEQRCAEAGINQSAIQFSWEVATPTDGSGARSPFETITDNTPFTSVNHKVLDSIYFSRRFHLRCVAKAVDKAGHVGTPLRSNVVTIGTDSAICHTPVVAGTARGFQAQSFVATLKYLDVKHKEHPNRIHISVQIPHQDGMLPLISTLPLHNLHFLLSESIYRHQHVCSNLVTARDLKGVSEGGFLEEVTYDSIVLGPGYDRPFQFDPGVREPKSIQLYRHLNLKSCLWTFDAYYDMTELIDVCGGSVTADFQVRDSAQSFLTVHVPLYVSYIYVTAPRGWASLEHHTEMEFSFFYDTVLWRTGIQTDSVLSARLQIVRIYIREDGRLVIEFKTQAKFRGLFVLEHHSLPHARSAFLTPEQLGGIQFDLQLLWSAQTFDSPSQLWRATSSYNRKDYSGEYSIFLIPCTVQPTQAWAEPGDKPLPCTAHAPERFLIPIAFQQTNRPVPVVYSLNTEFQLCNNEKVFLMDPTKPGMSLAEMDYKGAFSKGQILYGRVLWNPEQNLNAAYKLQLEKVYLCTGKDGHVPFFDPTGTVYNEGPRYGCIQPNKHLKHRFLLLDRTQPEVTDQYFHDVPFDAHFASDLAEFRSVSSAPGVDGFTLRVDALYKVEAGHQWYLQVIYVIGPESIAGPRVQRSLTRRWTRGRRDAALDDPLIYDNDGDQIRNGTNMKPLTLQREEAAAAASASPASASLGGALAAALLLLLLLLAGVCVMGGKRRGLQRKREQRPPSPKWEGGQFCTVRHGNGTVRGERGGGCVGRGGKGQRLNGGVKAQHDLQDGTEV
ncbi:extracellular matrix organizing protein FRAS1 isoform X3 [Columba livia]|uniref:extracellular matrix organizing protein FRAS1 isoform X3 n=1 Tax=Columba livia TaxID=8932 RepID=UPI0031BA7234